MKAHANTTRLHLGAALLAMMLGIMAGPTAALAIETRSGDAITLPAGETIDDDLAAAGGTVTIAGRVAGDVYALGRTVVVTGIIDGDLIAAAEQVTVDGSVLGDVRAGGSQVWVNGQVGKNVSAAGQRVTVSSSGRIGGSVLGGAETLSTFGQIGRGLTVGAGTAQIGGPVGGRVRADVGTLTLGPEARIGGGLDYRAQNEASLPPGTVAGPITFTQAERDDEDDEDEDRPSLLNGLFDVGGLIWLVGSALLGALAIRSFPAAPDQIVRDGRRRPLPVLAMGLGILVATPLVGLLAAITLIGLPLTLGLALLYGLGLLLAWPALGVFVGTLMAERVRRARALYDVWLLLLGLVALHLVTHIPVLGGLVTFFGLAFGLGLLAQLVLTRRRSPSRSAGASEMYSPSL